jgi:cytochrome c556
MRTNSPAASIAIRLGDTMESAIRRITACLALALPAFAVPQTHQHGNPGHSMADDAQAQAVPADGRLLVKFPEALRSHTLANMRDHLAALGEMQDALAKGKYDRAAEVAEQRLGMSSLKTHGAHEVARFMPQGMQDAGTAMHRSASQFATVAKDASVTGDLRPVLAAMSRINQTCVACHAGYRLH